MDNGFTRPPTGPVQPVDRKRDPVSRLAVGASRADTRCRAPGRREYKAYRSPFVADHGDVRVVTVDRRLVRLLRCVPDVIVGVGHEAHISMPPYDSMSRRCLPKAVVNTMSAKRHLMRESLVARGLRPAAERIPLPSDEHRAVGDSRNGPPAATPRCMENRVRRRLRDYDVGLPSDDHSRTSRGALKLHRSSLGHDLRCRRRKGLDAAFRLELSEPIAQARRMPSIQPIRSSAEAHVAGGSGCAGIVAESEGRPSLTDERPLSRDVYLCQEDCVSLGRQVIRIPRWRTRPPRREMRKGHR